MKFIKILLICLILCACSKTGDLNTNLDNIFSNTDPSKARLNNYTDYIDYYKPSDLNEFDADKLSFVFCLNDSKLILNVNIAGIINNQYNPDYAVSDDGFFDKGNLIYNKNSYFYDDDDNMISYFFNLYEYEDKYLMYFVDTHINIYAYCDYDEIELMATKIYALAKSCVVDDTAVLANYSSRDVIEYHKSTVDLFEKIMPVEGRVDDMLMDDDSNVADN